MLINKAVSPVMLPALLGLANVMANRRAAAAEGLAVTEGPPSGGAAKGLPSSHVGSQSNGQKKSSIVSEETARCHRHHHR